MKTVEVVPDSDALAGAAAEKFVVEAERAIGTRGRFAVALSGGSTPRAMYTLLAGDDVGRRVDWPRVHLFFGDERCVPPDDPESNYGMARESLIDHVPLPSANVERMHGEDEPGTAASAYEGELRAFFGSSSPPRFDLVLLGMGDNGHTASLFPGLPPIHEEVRWVVASYVEEVAAWRLTLTPVAINAAAEVTFLVSGAGKAAMLQRVLEGPYQPDLLPAQVINPREGQLRWLVDRAAGAQLTSIASG
jgi:6-phosphogluconolactonase